MWELFRYATLNLVGYTFIGIGCFVLGLLRLIQVAMVVTFYYYTWQPIWSPAYDYTASIHLSLAYICLMLSFILATALPLLVEHELLTRAEGKSKKRNVLIVLPILALLSVLLGVTFYELYGLWFSIIDILMDVSYSPYQPLVTTTLLVAFVALIGYGYIQDLERCD